MRFDSKPKVPEESSFEQKLKSRFGEISTLASKVSSLESKLNTTGGPRAAAGGPPSSDNVCSYCCGSPDHFVRDCPKKREVQARRDAAAAAAREAGTSAETS